MNKGDKVVLKGYDNPIMVVRYVRTGYRTINSPTEELAATCEWFDLDYKLHSHEFNIESLEVV